MPRKVVEGGVSLASTGPAKAPAIVCTSQQSRFHAETLDSTTEIDLHDVSISIGQNELIEPCRLRLKTGVRYALVGRNGSGKSTLLKAISEKLIPGLSSNLRILLLSQVDDSARAEASTGVTVLNHVINGDKRRMELLEKQKELSQAIESSSVLDVQRVVLRQKLAQRNEELAEAKKIAARRSGTRGKDARIAELAAEKLQKEAVEALDRLSLDNVDTGYMKIATDMLADIEVELNLLDSASAEARAATILVGLGFSQEMINDPYSSLSGGWRSRCSLAIALLVQGDVLLLDEPSNFLDLEATLWLESFLVTQTCTLVLTSHDRAFMDNVAEETVALRFKKLKYFEGTPSAMEVNEKKERRKLTKQKDAMDKRKEHIEKSIQQGKAAAKKSGDDNRLRMAKSRQKKLDERWGVETSAKGGRFKLNRDLGGFHLTNRAEITIEGLEPLPHVMIPSPEKLRTRGDLVHFDNVSFAHKGQKKPLLEAVTFTVNESGRVAFLGANGQGKSTLAKLIIGELKPTKGTIIKHPQLKIGYFSQHSVEELSAPDSKNNPTTALSYFMGHFEAKGENVDEHEARSCLGSFGLQGKTASDTPLVALSGGQKVRLALALIVFHPPTLLLLDEVTTHVDAPTIEAIGRALKSFTGAIILVTHDRWFSRVVVESASFHALRREQAGDVSESDSEESSEDDDDSSQGTSTSGKTYKVGGGKVTELSGGMVQYVGMVERKLAKRAKLASTSQ